MSDTPTLTGQDIGQAERATRALLDRVLAQVQTTFHQSVVLNLTANAPAPPEVDALVTRMAQGLKVDRSTARTAIDELVAGGLVDPSGDPATLALTPEGAARFATIRRGIDQIAERLYGDLPSDDLATTHRILAIVTERANAELA
ncbi:MAG TPA: MarR family winged helix-turn-helix transcriptional regulator [Acidimicrobiales bacterium]|nr:MarR family winged helix-turn-helix transcriptional regulator [Acidimicrobiales bacterium]